MRSVLSGEMDLILNKYNALISKYEENLLLMNEENIMNLFKLNYEELYYEVKNKSIGEGKARNEIKYAILKLRRLIAKWEKSGYFNVQGGITYSGDYGEFPLFQSQNFNITPTKLMVIYIQSRVIDNFIERHNDFVKQNNLPKKEIIKNLNDLRIELIKLFSDTNAMDMKRASMLARKYGQIYSGSNEMSVFTESNKIL